MLCSIGVTLDRTTNELPEVWNRVWLAGQTVKHILQNYHMICQLWTENWATKTHPHKTILVSQQALNYNIHFCVFKADFLCRHYKNKSRWKEVGEEERNSTKVGKQMGVLTFCPKHTLFMNSNFFICINQSLIYYYIFLFWSEHTLEIWLHIAT